MLRVMYFGLALIGVGFLMGLYKLWRFNRRMVARDRVLDARLMEAARAEGEAHRGGSPARGDPAQGSLWDE